MKMKIYLMGACAALLFASCSEDYLETKPTDAASQETILTSTANLKLAVNGLSKMMTVQYLRQQGANGEGTIKTWYGNYPGNDYQKSKLTGWASLMNAEHHERSTSFYAYYPWFYYYKLVGNANKIIVSVDAASGEEADKKFIKAQALTFRAYSFFMLSQLYSKRWVDSNQGASRGIVLRIDDSTGSLACSTLGQTYEQIYKDLDEAITNYTASGKHRAANANYAPDLNVAYAVYARAALTREDWANAAKYAALARDGYPLMDTKAYASGFNTPTSEWIWSVYNSTEETLHYYSFFAFEGSNGSGSTCRNFPSAISKELYDQIPATDIRKGMFLDPGTMAYNKSTGAADKDLQKYTKAKYGDKLFSTSAIYAYMQFKRQNVEQPGVGQFSLFRSSEMYLIEAEADCHLGKEAEARALLTALVKDSKRDPSFSTDKTGSELLDQVRLYRRVELWGEGYDWFDYKRWNLPIERHAANKGGSFHAQFAVTIKPEDKNAWTWVIPNKEVDYNSAIKSYNE